MLFRGGERYGSNLWAADVDAPLEIGTVFNYDSGILDIAYQLRIFTDEHFVGSVDTSL